MREIASLSISKDLNKKIARLSRLKGLTRSEMIREAVRQYLLREEVEAIRSKALIEAEARGGPYSDEDIFKKIS